jgi:hypothetical protein
MEKLDNIPKKSIFDTPDGYFDSLPGMIQARLAPREKPKALYTTGAFVLRFVLPVVMLVAVALFVFRAPKAQTPEQLLASVDTADLIGYLETSELTTEELLDQIDYSQFNTDMLEGQLLSLPQEDLKALNDALEPELNF